MKRVKWNGSTAIDVGEVHFEPGDTWNYWRDDNVSETIGGNKNFSVSEVADDDARGVIGRFYAAPPPE